MRKLNEPSTISLQDGLLLMTWKAKQARDNPNDFAQFAFVDSDGSPLVQAPIHRQLQRFLTKNTRALIELPRDHGKSMQICIRILWELGQRPGLRIKVVCASEALAMERGRFLRHAIENGRVQQVFPHLKPGQPWGADRFTIARPAEVIGPSVTAMGIGSASTGSRADLLICDDIVDVRSIRSAAERHRVKVFYRENLVNLLEPDGRLWNVFTPWHQDDLNALLKKNGVYPHFRRAIGDDLTPIWPEKWPSGRLQERRKEIGETSFARAYRLVCVPDDAVPIRPDWVKFWTEPAKFERVILAVDPAVSAKRTADASALVVLGEMPTGEIHCLDAQAVRVPMPDLVNLIAVLDRQWRPQVIVFESNAAFAGIRDLLIRHTSFGGKLDDIVQVRDKMTRIQTFSVPVRNGTFQLKGEQGVVDSSQQELFDEMTTFPVGEHDDLVDAAACGTEYLMNRREPRVW
jgi:predicted phage terminase large subunit-like protein